MPHVTILKICYGYYNNIIHDIHQLYKYRGSINSFLHIKIFKEQNYGYQFVALFFSQMYHTTDFDSSICE